MRKRNLTHGSVEPIRKIFERQRKIIFLFPQVTSQVCHFEGLETFSCKISTLERNLGSLSV